LAAREVLQVGQQLLAAAAGEGGIVASTAPHCFTLLSHDVNYVAGELTKLHEEFYRCSSTVATLLQHQHCSALSQQQHRYSSSTV
jgi:hypothetical protein